MLTRPALAAFDFVNTHGVPIFPCHAATKASLIKDWPNRATTCHDQIARWWSRWPDALIAVPMGARARAWCVDPDGAIGRENWANLVAKHGLPATRRFATPNGERFLFRNVAGVHVKSSAGQVAEKVDVRGHRADGTPTGYTIVPPSVTAAGGVYRWIGPEGFDELPEAPPWLLFLAMFSSRERTALAAAGVTGPEAFHGLPPAAWKAHSVELLKAARPARVLSRGADRPGIERYCRRAIQAECTKIAAAPEGRRDVTLNSGAMCIWSLVKGARLHGVELEEWAHGEYLAAADHMRIEIDVDEKWERTGREAGARNLDGVRGRERTDARDDFDPLDEDQGGQPAAVLWVDDQPLESGIEWLVEDTIPKRSIGFLAAASGKGKTFLAIDLMLSLAYGRPFFGRAVDVPCGCFLVAGEGAYAVTQRVRAARTNKFKSDQGVALAYTAHVPNLLKEKELCRFIEHLQGVDACMRARYGVPLQFVAFDTFASCFRISDENDVRETSKATAIKRRIAEALGAVVMSVHHHGKDERTGMRGSSGLKADADFVLSVPKKGQLHLSKSRDAAEGRLGSFGLAQVEIGTTAKGKPITSCYVDNIDFEIISGDAPTNESETAFREAFQGVATERDHPDTGEIVSAATVNDVRKRFYELWSDKADAARKAFLRVRRALSEEFQEFDGWIYTH
jgi:hypothetical protein